MTAQAVKKKLASDRNPTFQLISPLNSKNATVVEKVIKGKGSAEKKRKPDDTPPPAAAKKRKTGKWRNRLLISGFAVICWNVNRPMNSDGD